MTSCIKGVVALSLTCIAVDAFATFVSESDVRKAAEAFVSTDTIGSSVLSGRSVAGASKRDGLWIVALAPSGHVIFSGSDLVDPIVGFSENDFVEPDPESPAFAVLEGADASIAAAEAQGAGTRHARWAKLLGGMAKKGLLKAADVESPGTIVIPPFLESHYNQWQPYNDYAPVFEPDENYFESGREPYRGRCPCGCVATASAQIFHHFKWPARIDSAISWDHVFLDDAAQEKSFHVRFDGHEPIYWNAISNEYAYSYRSGVDETVRYPIARLILWCDVLARMEFESSGSGSSYDTIASNVSEWYTPGHWVDMSDGVEQVKNDILAGVPCQVSIEGYDQYGYKIGHEVIAHGWAEEGSTKYVSINFGWGGDNDGYYNIDDNFQEYSEKKVYVGHYPRAKPQVDPLPTVSGTSLSLNWHFPDFYTNNLSGFTVSMSRTATTPSTFLDDFSATTGTPSSDLFAVGEDSRGYDGNLLYALSSLGSSYFTFPEKYTLTSASLLTFRLRSYCALGNSFEVQARFDGGDWITILTPELNANGDSGWSTERVYLGEHGGETVQLRLFKTFPGGSYYPNTKCILVDDFTVTDVLAPVEPEIMNVGKTERSLVLDGLAAGATYSFAVTPNISGALVDGESSDPVSTSIAGSRNAPIPGEQTYTPATLSFSASDTSGVWSYSGTAANETSVSGGWNCSIGCSLPGELVAGSMLSFDWTADDYYDVYGGQSGYDVLSVEFMGASGVDDVLWCYTNTSAKTSKQNVALSLSQLSGQIGKIVISYSHVGPGFGVGGVIYAPQITNVQVPSVPVVAWDTETLVALGTPEILSVSAVSEGFYGECWTNTTTFLVDCSNTVVKLEARPSHLSLVNDDDVSVSLVENGKFKVCVTPSGINESNFRSRMILTLVGTDSNGTKCYKDLSLRFSQVEPKPTEVHVEATTSSGVAFSVDIPYSWLEDNGLVASGSDAAAHASTADADSDGLPNWAEYVCGTDPSDPDDKLTASITMVDGEPVVTYTPADGIASGFKAVIKGTTDLSAALSTWEVVTDTRTSTCRFFRVEIVPEN